MLAESAAFNCMGAVYNAKKQKCKKMFYNLLSNMQTLGRFRKGSAPMLGFSR